VVEALVSGQFLLRIVAFVLLLLDFLVAFGALLLMVGLKVILFLDFDLGFDGLEGDVRQVLILMLIDFLKILQIVALRIRILVALG
jgi:hypothetical protein